MFTISGIQITHRSNAYSLIHSTQTVVSEMSKPNIFNSP
jgi:hypothetical protein